MSISDTRQAQRYASIAEVAAAECKLLTEEARKAPEYTNQAKEYAESSLASAQESSASALAASNSEIASSDNAISAQTSADSASQSEQSAADSASSAASSAADANADAQIAFDAVNKTIRVSDNSINPIPGASERANKVLTFDSSGNPLVTTPASGSAQDVLNQLALPTGATLVGYGDGTLSDIADQIASQLSQSFSFDTGGELNSQRDFIYSAQTKLLYYWLGEYPKIVPALSSPDSTGGIGENAWALIGDTGVFAELAKPTGSGMIGGNGVVITSKQYAGGVKGDGVANDYAALKAAADDANARKLPLICPPGLKVKITGSSDIEFQNGFDFNGSTLDVSAYAGQVKTTRSSTPVVYGPSSSLISDMVAGGAITGIYWPALLNHPEVNDCFLKIQTSQPLYTYRGVATNRTDRVISLRNGVVEAAPMFTLSPATITSITAFKLPDKYIEYKNIVFDMGSNQLRNNNISIASDMTIIENWSFIQSDFDFTTANPVYITISESARVRVNNLSFKWPNKRVDGTFTYALAADYNYDLQFDNVTGFGDGWGVIGFNENRRNSFKNCLLSRVDSHQPFIEWLKLKDCHIGQWGVAITAIGDFEMTGGSITISDADGFTGKLGFITSRHECGGICQGRATVDGVTLKNFTSTATQKLFYHNADTADAPPSGSPVTYQYWSSINVSNIKSDNKTVDLAPFINASSGIKYPESIVATNCIDGIFTFSDSGFGSYTPNSTITTPVNNAVDQMANVKIALDKVRAPDSVTIVDAGIPQKWLFHIVLNNIMGGTVNNPAIIVKAGGVLDISNSIIEGIDVFSSTAIDRYLRINMVNGAIRHTGRFRPTAPINGANQFTDISISNAHLQSLSSTTIKLFAKARLSNCSFSISGSVRLAGLQLTNDAAASTDTGVTLIDQRSQFMLYTTVSGTVRRSPFTLPPTGGSSYVQIDSGVYANITYTGSTIGVTATGASLGYVYIQ
ncbi:hypothetical protein QQF21_17895 [Lelliottia sp. V89_10]|uniref:tail fiber/spike domain-containing protein n=1 Tax=Lelliottia wanjuensis TaxID=3050585 RepID=UPI00249E00A0|nr:MULTISPECIES: hypothetical protein [unclassified Lelliottia]MDI3361134.1 hypothetical protein [Lelliottia sp. V89_13]MDK9551233.1 hypothetical protein [Lelliottia sp. V89_5]MDK9597495.1 hypothetical protein [Lelliottia sp. V89_10]